MSKVISILNQKENEMKRASPTDNKEAFLGGNQKHIFMDIEKMELKNQDITDAKTN